MKETRTINLNGQVFHIDHDAYQNLRDYLHDIEMRLPVDDKLEVMEDLEARIAELFQNALFAKNIQVVNQQLVDQVQSQIGKPADFGPNRRPTVKVNKSQNAGCGRVLSIVLNVVLGLLALPVIFIGMMILFAIVMALFGVAVAGTTTLGAILPMAPALADLLVDGGAILLPLLMIALIAIIALPIVMIVKTIVSYMRTRRGPKARFWWATILLWIGSIIFWGSFLVRIYHSVDNAPEILRSFNWDELEMDEEGIITTSLQLPAYHSIQLTGAAQLQLSNAPVASTMLTTSLVHTVMDTTSIKAEVKDSVLYIHNATQQGIKPTMAVFQIAVPDLRQITVYGASKIENVDETVLTLPALALDLNGAAQADLQLLVDELTIDAKGASKLELEGSATDVRITLAGAGEIEAEDFVAQYMHINCAGASKAEVNVVRELWAQAAGASKITYKGNPTIKQKMAVGGSVIGR